MTDSQLMLSCLTLRKTVLFIVRNAAFRRIDFPRSYCAAQLEDFRATLDAHTCMYLSHWLARFSGAGYRGYVRYWVQFCTYFRFPAINFPSKMGLCRYVSSYPTMTCASKKVEKY